MLRNTDDVDAGKTRRWSRRWLVGVAVVATLLVAGVPVYGASGWKLKAMTSSRGASVFESSSVAAVTIPRPTAVRFGFSSPKGKPVEVSYWYDMTCEGRGKTRQDQTVTTPADGSITYVVAYRPGTEGLGRYCDAFISSYLADNPTFYKMRIEAQHN